MNWRALLVFICSFPAVVFAQTEEQKESDTLIVQAAKDDYQLHFQDYSYTELKGFQHYRPIGRNRLPWARSGNIGLPVHSFDQLEQDWTINSHLGGYQPYLLTQDSMRYYKMSRPFTELIYANGAEEEQYFKAFHSQNLGEGLNISFRYDRITSPGFFLQQLTNHTRFHTTYNLQSRDARFRSKGYFLINSLEAQENGGVISSTNDNPDDNTVLLDINLRDAQNRLRSQELFLDQYFDLWRTQDSTTLLSLNYSFKWSKAFRNFSENLSAEELPFYQNYYLDEVQSADTAYADQLSHYLGLAAWDGRISLGYEERGYHYFQNQLTDTDFSSQFVRASFQDTLWGYSLKANLEKGLGGFEKDEVDLQASVGFPKFKSLHSRGFVRVFEHQPDFFINRQRANHFLYDESWTTSKQRLLGAELAEEKSGVQLKAEFIQLQDFVYFDSLALPQQESESIQTVRLSLSKEFHFLRNFYLFNRLLYQQISNQEVLPMPELYSYHSLYYDNQFFKENLGLQVGVDFYYIGEYQGYAYNPALAQFHLRNEGESLGNIQQLDLFLKLRISTSARLFVKYENVLQTAFSEDSYRIQDYPIPGRVLKFGLSWRMIN
ncbi:MAG: putative porin [Vicingaceae bacterium]